MKILVTGATGFVGRHVTAALNAEGHDVAAVVRRGQVAPEHVKILEGDLDNFVLLRSDVRAFAPDACVHLAWQGIPNYAWDISSRNLRRSLALVELLVAETCCRRVVAAGSCMEYGRTQGACRESQTVTPASHFAWAKLSFLQHLAMMAADGRLDYAWLRLFYVYGPGQRSDSLLPTAVAAMQRGEQPAIRNPLNAQDFVYISDVAEAFRAAVALDASTGVFNVGSGTPTSVLEMCRLAEAALGCGNAVSTSLKGMVPPEAPTSFWADLETVRNELGWQPRVAVGDGVGRHVRAIQEAEPCSSMR